MLEAIRMLGKISHNAQNYDFISDLVEYESVETKDNRGNQLYLLVINFNTAEDQIELEPKTLDYNRFGEYLWIGNSKGNLPQDRLTTNTLKYLLASSLLNLYNGLKECELKETLKNILDRFFITVEFDGKKVYVLNLNKISYLKDEPKLTLPEVNREYNDKKDFEKDIMNQVEKIFLDVVKKYLGFEKKDLALFSVTIDGNPPSVLSDYKRYIEEKIIEESFDDGFEGVCHICGKRDTVTSNTTRFPAKFYMTNLITFSSDLEGLKPGKGFSRNFALCRDCYKDIIFGVKYVQNYLQGKLAGNDLWIIPGLFFNPVGREVTKGWTEYSKSLTISTFTMDSFLDFEEKVERGLEDYRRYEELLDYSFVDLLFYKKNKEAFKIKELIKDIPLRRVYFIHNAIKETRKLAEEILGGGDNWFIGLNDIYFLIPIRRGKASEYKKILDIYEDIFLANRLDKRALINWFTELFSIYRFEKFSQYNVGRPKNIELAMVFAVLKTNLLLKLFERLGIITGGECMSEPFGEILDQDMINYISKIGYGEEESALFLLGYLIGEIGNAQMEGTDYNAKKPILNKINFNGISAKSLINLSNDVFEKLDQYRIRGYNEKIYAAMKELMDRHIKNWSLSDSENVYYIMSGYAHNTYRRIKNIRKEEKSDE